MENNKTQRILKMLMLLSGGRRYTLRELADKFQLSERSIIRDLNAIEAAGFILHRENGYRLYMSENNNRGLGRLLHFSEDEIAILYKTLTTIEGDTAVIDRLMKKMNAFYDLKAIEELSQKNDFAKVQIIREGMRQKKQIILLSYRSSNSSSVEDRRVEGFKFMPDYQTVWCYDCNSHSCKQFKLSRMESVALGPSGWRYEKSHREPFTDIFRFSEDQPKCSVELRLTLKAYNTLIEEYPRSIADVKPEGNNHYYLKTKVASYIGIGRFVMSMLEDVEIIRPASFKNHIRKRMENHLKR